MTPDELVPLQERRTLGAQEGRPAAESQRDATSPAPVGHDSLLREVIEQLVTKFGDRVPRQTIEQIVQEAYDDLLAHSRLTTFLAVLTLKAATARLTDLERNPGTSHPPPRP